MNNDRNDKNLGGSRGQVRITSEDVRISMSRIGAAKKSKKRIMTAIALTAIACIAALAVVDIIFFNVKTVNVIGNSMYSREGILESANIAEGTNFLALRAQNIIKSVKNDYPGISEIKVVRKLPSTVELQITESKPVMYITVGEFFYTLDENLVVLEKFENFDSVEMLGLMRIYLPEVTSCIAGEYIVTNESDVPEMVKRLCSELYTAQLLSEVNEINFTNKFDITFTLGVKYTVKLGSIIDCDIKLEFLRGILEELDEDDVGTIDFSDGDIREAIFSRS